MRIVTNILKNISEPEKTAIQNVAKSFDIVFYELRQKGMPQEGEEDPKFVFDGFNLKNTINNATEWELFNRLVHEIFLMSKKNSEHASVIQIWIIGDSNGSPINIAFAIRSNEEIDPLFITLREVLQTKVYSQKLDEQKSKIILIGYDKENNTWAVSTI